MFSEIGIRLVADGLRELTKMVTGELLTEVQIKAATNNIVGRHFADWFPTPQREAEVEKRIIEARLHITEAMRIVSGLQNDLEQQTATLGGLAKEIEDKKKTAEKYALLAQTNQAAFSAFRTEMEDTVRKELTNQSEKGKNVRRFASFIFWATTLILGAALGAYFEISFEPFFQKTPNQVVPIQSPQVQPGTIQPAGPKGNGSK